MRFTKSLAVVMMMGLPAVAHADPMASALSATFCKCSLIALLSPTTIAVSAATGNSATASAVASIVGETPSSGALASGSTSNVVAASVKTTGSVYESYIVVGSN